MGRLGQLCEKAVTLQEGPVSCKMEATSLKSHTTGEHLDMGGSHPSRAKQPVKLALLGNRDVYRRIRKGFLEKKERLAE